MGRPKTIARQIIEEQCKKFPKTPNLTLAKKIYKENPEMFTDVDAVRTCVRTVRGTRGVIARKNTVDKSLYDTEERSRNPFNLPVSHAEVFTPYKIDQSKVLIISDLHFPYQDNDAITLALQYGLEKKVDCILINGDLIDFATISRHEKDFRARSIKEEFDSVRQFLRSLREAFPRTKIVFKKGNHSSRWEKYLYVKAPEIFDVAEFRLDILLRLGELRIDMIEDDLTPVKIGKLTVLHGHELFGSSGGVNPARATFTKTLASVLVGHYHKTSSHTEMTLDGNLISVNSTGCLCGVSPRFASNNKWNHGFAYVEHDIKTGEYHLHNLKIYKGKIY